MTAEVRQKLRAAGFNPLPLVGKVPVLKAWQKRAECSAGDIDIWEKLYPAASNTGILTARTPALDIDLTDPEAAAAVEALVRERFEEHGSILVRFGRPPKRAMLFRTETPFPKIIGAVIAPDGSTEQKLEFLCDGQQIVVDGIHPGTGKAYSWYGGAPGEIKYDDLPYIHLEQAQVLINDAVELLVRNHGYTRPQAKPKPGNGFDQPGQADWGELLAAIHDGRDLHYSLTRLAAKLIASGMGEGAATNFLRELLQCSSAGGGSASTRE